MTTSDPVIEVRDLVKVYGRDTRALDGVTFDVGAGELFGFLGPNGAGKTTTIRILSTLLRPTEGSARVAGFDVAAHPHEVRKRLGLAMQTPSLDAFSTGRETLELAGRLHRLPAGEIRRRADELLELMGLAGGRQEADRHVLGRHEAAARPGERADASAAAPHPRRAHRRPRPAEPHRAVGGARAHQRRGHDDAADDALHGGGRPPVLAPRHRRHRQASWSRATPRQTSSRRSAPTRWSCSSNRRTPARRDRRR